MNTGSPSTRLERLVRELDSIVAAHHDEQTTTSAVADSLRRVLAEGLDLDEATTRPHPDRYVMYPLHVDPAGRYSIASAVWNVGQETPVHGHETWGVVGIWSGIERETKYEKPVTEAALTAETTHEWGPGDVTVCCTTDDDIHQVSCGGDKPCVGIHVYGANIGTLSRRSYNPDTGAVSWFVSRWTEPAVVRCSEPRSTRPGRPLST